MVPVFRGLLTICLLSASATAATVRVETAEELRSALARARAGTTIRIAPGKYEGGLRAEDLRGTARNPIVIAGADPADPPVIEGGTSGLHVAGAEWLEIRNLVLHGARGNGLNLDDGGRVDAPSRHVTLQDLLVEEVGPHGNRDGIKLSGVTDFRVEGCRIRRWGSGGSGIDMVGCHRGEIVSCSFSHEDGKGGSGIQAKGGSSGIAIRRCRFSDAGRRAVNLGGSTGTAYFRPADAPHEAKDLTVEDCLFLRSLSPIAFVGVDGAVVRHNTIVRPGKWVMRILQESQGEEFVPCRNGRFERNLVVFRSADVRVAANVGPGTEPDSFVFAENFWYCEDEPGRSRPDLPTDEKRGVYGKDPGVAALLENGVAGRGPARDHGVRKE